MRRSTTMVVFCRSCVLGCCVKQLSASAACITRITDCCESSGTDGFVCPKDDPGCKNCQVARVSEDTSCEICSIRLVMLLRRDVALSNQILRHNSARVVVQELPGTVLAVDTRMKFGSVNLFGKLGFILRICWISVSNQALKMVSLLWDLSCLNSFLI